jgi:GNAT superfamily N-acetyltransferase
VTEEDLGVLLPLVRAYCDFYEVAPTDAALLAVSRALISDPAREGLQLLARDGSAPERPAVGFATLYWTWSTTRACRLATMNDLYVAPVARGAGVAEALIASCRDAARVHGAAHLAWTTAPDNHRAQAVYDRVHGRRSEWVHYDVPTGDDAASSVSAQPDR